MPLPPVHLVIMQPAGYLHSQGLLDQARYFRHQFRRLGAEVSLAKNRLREDAVNLVFGAHLGFEPEWLRRHACLIVNLEQLGPGGANVKPDYLALLRTAAVVDYDSDNVAAYAQDPADVPIVPFLHAPYLASEPTLPLEERPIDLLFFGCMNERRRAWIQGIEASGVEVAFFDHPLYGPERDAFIRQAKAVFNCHHYEASRFEQARAFQCLSMGTPVISERGPSTRPPAAYEDSVFWVDCDDLSDFFGQVFGSPEFYAAARQQLAHFATQDPTEAYADLLAFAAGFHQAWGPTRATGPWRPTRLAADPARGYRPGWLNVSAELDPQLDARLDLGRRLSLPLTLLSPAGQPIELHANGLLAIELDAEALPPNARQTALANALALLADDGSLSLSLPADEPRDGQAAQLPPEAQAWCRSAAEFWRHGPLTHRFQVEQRQLRRSPGASADGTRQTHAQLLLRKTPVTLRERSLARPWCADFGGVPEDLDGLPSALAPSAPAQPASTVQADQPELTVVCVSYKRYEQIPILIHSFLSQTLQSYKLLILHDGPDERMRQLLAPYCREHPGKIEVVFTEQRYNDYGHTLRDLGIRMADTPYLLITNDDNYYAPKFLEFMVPPMKARQADIAMCNMIHSHDRPGCRPQPSYMPFETRPARGSVDIGCFIARTDWAQRVGFRDKSHDGDATYFEDLLGCADKPTVLKVDRTLFVHN